MKKHFSILFVTALALVAFVACGSPYTLESSNVMNNADFTKYKTFSVLEPSTADLPSFMSKMDYDNIANVIAGEMEQRGYKRVKNNPDLLINFGLSAQEKIETKDALPPTAGRGFRFMGPRASYVDSYYSDAKVISDVYKEGLLSMDVVDAAKNMYLFNAVVGAVMDGSGSKIRDFEQLQQAADKLFSKFPVAEIAAK